MAGLTPQGQAGAWQLISVNNNRQSSTDIPVIAEKLLELTRTRTHVLVMFSVQETRSCDVLNLELPVCVMVSNLGSQRFWFRNSFAQLRGHGGSKRDVQRFSSDMEMCDACDSSVLKVVREGRRGGKDLNVELGRMCNDENDIERNTWRSAA